ncbi:MAG: hypothetical protein ACREJR_11315, partial [Candidatus Rokuibacteriota bacterium]
MTRTPTPATRQRPRDDDGTAEAGRAPLGPPPVVGRVLARTAGILVVLATGLLGCGRAPAPPAPDVVATYAGGQITVDQIRRLVEGETRGLRVVVGDTLQPVKPEHLTPEIYRGLVQELVLDAMVRELVKERQLDRKESIRHALKHGEEEVALGQLHGDLHAK